MLELYYFLLDMQKQLNKNPGKNTSILLNQLLGQINRFIYIHGH